MADVDHQGSKMSAVALWADDQKTPSMDANMIEIDEGSAPDSSASPEGEDIINRGFQAFLRDLPTLLADKRNYRKLVAYRGSERIAIAASQRKLFKKCMNVPENELMVECIAPHPLAP